ncbi:MAG: hypothetical protein QM718_02410 [Steroidobacteraceae bacterium]
MITFVVLAAVLMLAAVGFVLLPLLRRSGDDSARRREVLPAVTLGVLIVALGAALYWQLGNHQWQRSAAPGSEAIQAALRATDAQPQNVTAWLQLAQAYTGAEQYALALRAFEQADTLAAGGNAAALAGMGEILLLQASDANSTLVKRASEKLEQALQVDPRNAKALFYSGAIALRSGQLQLARDRFALMLQLDTPDKVRAALQKQVAAIDAALHPEPADPATALKLTVQIKPELAAKVDGSWQLFVFVRAPEGGAPLAVKRLAAQLPATLELSARDSMLAGREIKAGQKVDVVARLSRSGTPTAQSGDPFGELRMVAGQKSAGTIVIDQQSP